MWIVGCSPVWLTETFLENNAWVRSEAESHHMVLKSSLFESRPSVGVTSTKNLHTITLISSIAFFEVRICYSAIAPTTQKWRYDYTEVVSIQAQDTDSRHGKFMKAADHMSHLAPVRTLNQPKSERERYLCIHTSPIQHTSSDFQE